MRPLVVLADDLTGAAEIAGIGVEFGMRAVVARGAYEGEAELVVFDTDSRGMAAAEAAGRVEEVLEKWVPAEGELIFKKVDSVLRGQIQAEMAVIQRRLGMRRMVLVAQNPSKGRVITREGVYLVNGVPLERTTFREDPEYPRRTSDAAALVGVGAWCGRSNEELPPVGVVVGCGETLEEVARWAWRTAGQASAGGADMFRAVLEERGLKRVEMEAMLPRGKTVVVCGSSADYSRRMVETWERAGVAICAAGDALFAAPWEGALIARWAGEAAAALGAKGTVVLAVRQNVVPERARLLRGCMAEVVRQIVKAELKSIAGELKVFIEGGATAAAIVEAMGWGEFEMVGNVAPGVVVMRPVGALGVLVVMKPGSYPWGEKVLGSL